MAYDNITRAIERLAGMEERLKVLATLRTLADGGADLLLSAEALPHRTKLSKAIVLQAIDAQVQQITGNRDALKAQLDALAASFGG